MATAEPPNAPRHPGAGGQTTDGAPATRRSRRAEQILDAAMALFAERGYANTSVADIQTAAGMTPGSGALYKHFSSKQSLLEAGVERFVSEGQAAATELTKHHGELEACLRDMADGALQALARDSATMRVVWRDLPAFPDMSQRVLDARLQHGFAQLTRWLNDLDQSGAGNVEDPDATAAVLLGALAYFRLMETMLGEKPGQVSDRRFLDAWVRLASQLLTGPRTDPSARTRP